MNRSSMGVMKPHSGHRALLPCRVIRAESSMTIPGLNSFPHFAHWTMTSIRAMLSLQHRLPPEEKEVVRDDLVDKPGGRCGGMLVTETKAGAVKNSSAGRSTCL